MLNAEQICGMNFILNIKKCKFTVYFFGMNIFKNGYTKKVGCMYFHFHAATTWYDFVPLRY